MMGPAYSVEQISYIMLRTFIDGLKTNVNDRSLKYKASYSMGDIANDCDLLLLEIHIK